MRTLLQMLSNNRGEVVVETDGDLLARQAYEEQNAEKEGREPVDLIAKSKEDEAKAESERKAEEEAENLKDPNEPDIEVAGAPEEEEPEKKPEEEETGDEDPKPEEDGEEEPETEESKEKKEKDEDAKITAYSEKHGMTYAEAKDDIDKTNSILEQFKNNPEEMARALRNKDREYDKLKNETEKEKESPVVFKRLTEEQYKRVAQGKIDEDPDKFLEVFKKRYPAKSELLSDEAIFEEMIDKEWSRYQVYATDAENDAIKDSVKMKEKIISNISKEDRRFIPEVKAFLESLTPMDVLDKAFDPEYVLHLAKGKRFDAEIKAAEERGFKRASEGKKILGVKSSDGKQPVTKKKAYSGDLNREQRYRASEMFPLDDGYSEERSYEMFKDTYKKELKENPNYL